MIFTSISLFTFAATVSSVLAAPAPQNRASVLSARAGAPFRNPIVPGNDTTKCVGLVGGKFANGTLVDIYDCNNSVSQKWQWWGSATDAQTGKFVNQTVTITPLDDSAHYCLDAGNVDQLAPGVQVKIWQCTDGLPQQIWTMKASGQIALSTGDYCLELPNGIKANKSVLQISQCADGNVNQIWSIPSSS